MYENEAGKKDLKQWAPDLKPFLSVYIWTSEILYIVNIQKCKLRMLMNTPILSLTL